MNDRPCFCQPGDDVMVAVPAEGDWLVRDGAITQVHQIRKEADFLFNRCSPDDPCGAQDGCNE